MLAGVDAAGFTADDFGAVGFFGGTGLLGGGAGAEDFVGFFFVGGLYAISLDLLIACDAGCLRGACAEPTRVFAPKKQKARIGCGLLLEGAFRSRKRIDDGRVSESDDDPYLKPDAMPILPSDIAVARAVVRETCTHRRHNARFPLTGGWMQQTSKRLGRPLGEHKALAVVRVLISEGTIVPDGSYRQKYRKDQPSGWRVPLYRRGVTAPRSGRPYLKSSIRRQRSVKGQRPPKTPWWQHPLFGNPGGERPKGVSKRTIKWSEPPDWKLPWAHEEALIQLSPTDSIRDYFDGRGTSWGRFMKAANAATSSTGAA